MLIKCPECGKEVSDKANFCPHCGCPIPHEEVKEETKAEETKSQPVELETVNDNYNQFDENKREVRRLEASIARLYRIRRIILAVALPVMGLGLLLTILGIVEYPAYTNYYYYDTYLEMWYTDYRYYMALAGAVELIVFGIVLIVAGGVALILRSALTNGKIHARKQKMRDLQGK